MVAIATSATVTIVPAIAQAAEPPVIYSNAKMVPTSPMPVVGDGKIILGGPILGEVRCMNTFNANVFNQHERLEAANPVRGYGEITGWATSSCVSPTLGPPLERELERKVTVFISPEMPLEEQSVEAEVCTTPGKPPSECKNSSERTTERLISAVRRRVGSVPWKFEMTRGTRQEEEGVLAKVGLHEFGEPGNAEQQSTACYPKEKFVNPETAKEEERPVKFTQIPSGCLAVDVIVPQIPLELVFYGTQEIWNVNGFVNGLHPTRWEFLRPGKLFSSEGLEGESEFTGSLRVSGAEVMQLVTAK
jgi:hypothetical protein